MYEYDPTLLYRGGDGTLMLRLPYTTMMITLTTDWITTPRLYKPVRVHDQSPDRPLTLQEAVRIDEADLKPAALNRITAQLELLRSFHEAAKATYPPQDGEQFSISRRREDFVRKLIEALRHNHEALLPHNGGQIVMTAHSTQIQTGDTIVKRFPVGWIVLFGDSHEA
ncbi:MAG: hypothetical protein AAF125_02675 [Chloroflexota bacterium]